MGVYILRRLLLMIPTLIGITFLVFMLVALSPGGIGAGLRFTPGGQAEATSAAVQEAYLEDRYGLDAPAPVQYVRWLERISPIKFGVRDQIDPSGERIRPPKPIQEPPLRAWFTDGLPPDPEPQPEPEPQAQAFAFEPEADDGEKARVYRRQANAYAQARAAFVAARALLEEEIARYARENDLDGLVDADGDLRERRLLEIGPPKDHPAWPAIERAGEAMLSAHRAAREERARTLAVFNAKPFREAGVSILDDRLSLSAPDFGRSFSRSRPVTDLIAEALPVTLLINALAIPVIYFVAIPCGMLAAVRQNGLFDSLSGLGFLALWSLPIPLAGVLCVGYLGDGSWMDSLGLPAFPTSGLSSPGADAWAYLPSWGEDGFNPGYLLDLVWHVCLPVLCLTYTGFAVLSKQTRAAMLDNFNQDYVRTAKAKGVKGSTIVFAHVFRNSLIPLITIFVSIFPAMLSGSVVIERIFSINGMGALALDAITQRDREVILATTLMISTVNLVALLLADILYALADPRISYS